MSTLVKQAQFLIQAHHDLKVRSVENLEGLVKEANKLLPALENQVKSYEDLAARNRNFITALSIIAGELARVKREGSKKPDDSF